MPGIGIINNPHSRKNRKNPQKMVKFGYILGDKGTSIKTQDLDEVAATTENNALAPYAQAEFLGGSQERLLFLQHALSWVLLGLALFTAACALSTSAASSPETEPGTH